MASLLEIRQQLALHGRLEAHQLSTLLATPLPRVNDMLWRMEQLGKVSRVTESADDCLSGSCKSCPTGQQCLREWWSLR